MKYKTKLPLIYIIGLPIIVLVANALANIKFTILGSYLSVSAFLYPLSFFITCLIIKKTNYKNALRIMIFALAAEALAFVFVAEPREDGESPLMKKARFPPFSVRSRTGTVLPPCYVRRPVQDANGAAISPPMLQPCQRLSCSPCLWLQESAAGYR